MLLSAVPLCDDILLVDVGDKDIIKGVPLFVFRYILLTLLNEGVVMPTIC